MRLLQTLTLLATTNTVCQGEALARALVICFRLEQSFGSLTFIDRIRLFKRFGSEACHIFFKYFFLKNSFQIV